MSTASLLYKNIIPINDYISIVIPKVGDVIDNETEYYNLVSMLTAMPIDFMCQLEDAGIDFTSIDEYQLFLLLFSGLREQDTSLVFGDLDLRNFKTAINEQNGDVVLIDPTKDIKIDKVIHYQISNTLRKMHRLEKNNRKPANKEAKEYMLDRARKKLNRRRRQPQESQLEPLILALVNTEQFKYNFQSVRDLSIYQFNESVRQVIKKVDYDNRMYGVYSGNVSVKDLSQNDLNWLTNK